MQSKRTLQNLKHFKILVFWDVMLCWASNPDVSKDHKAFNFKAEVLYCLDLKMRALLIPWNVRNCSPNNTASHPTRLKSQQHQCENIKSCIHNSPFSTTSRQTVASNQPRYHSQEVTYLGCEAEHSSPCSAPFVFLVWHSAKHRDTLHPLMSLHVTKYRQSSFNIAPKSTVLL